AADEAVAAWRAGRVDVVRDLDADEVERLLRDRRLAGRLLETPRDITYFLLANANGPLCCDADLRAALRGVVRPQDDVRRALGRFAEPAASLFPPGFGIAVPAPAPRLDVG